MRETAARAAAEAGDQVRVWCLADLHRKQVYIRTMTVSVRLGTGSFCCTRIQRLFEYRPYFVFNPAINTQAGTRGFS